MRLGQQVRGVWPLSNVKAKAGRLGVVDEFRGRTRSARPRSSGRPAMRRGRCVAPRGRRGRGGRRGDRASVGSVRRGSLERGAGRSTTMRIASAVRSRRGDGGRTLGAGVAAPGRSREPASFARATMVHARASKVRPSAEASPARRLGPAGVDGAASSRILSNLVLGPVDLGLAAAESLRLAGPPAGTPGRRAAREPGVSGIVCDQRRVSSRCFDCGLAATGGQPGPQRPDLGRVEPIGRQVRDRGPETVDVVGRHGQVEAGAPDREVIRPSLQAALEPAGRHRGTAGEDRHDGPAPARPGRRRRRRYRVRTARHRPDRRMIEHPEFLSTPGGSVDRHHEARSTRRMSSNRPSER